MDPIIGVWITSVVGAAAFTAAGYLLGQRDILPFGSRRTAFADGSLPPGPLSQPPHSHPSMPASPAAPSMPMPAAAPSPSVSTPAPPPATSEAQAKGPTGTLVLALSEPPVSGAQRDGEARETMKAATSMPPPELLAELQSAKDDLKVAIARSDLATKTARDAEAARADLAKQLNVLRAEHRQEIVARVAAEEQTAQYGNRLAYTAEEAAGLRRKVAQLERVNKQHSESLQGRVRSLTSSELDRRKIEEETEAMSEQLRALHAKLERSSLRPGAEGGTRPTPRERKAASGIDVGVLRDVVHRIADVPAVRGAVLADEVGAVIYGAGETNDALAAFGAYIKDASARLDRLLPLDPLVEISVLDRAGRRLSTRWLPGSSDLSIVIFANGGAALLEAERIVAEGLRKFSSSRPTR